MAGAGQQEPQDRYQRLEKVGEGSCGVVFKCRDRDLDRIVAVKRIRFSYDGDVGANKRQAAFGVPAAALREVACLRALGSHPNIVEILDSFLDGRARIFVVAEYFGCNLRQHMDKEGPLHARRAKLFLWQLLRATRHCHERSIAHRDMKPQNVLVDGPSDVVKLCDFSLARQQVAGAPQTQRVASLWYRSPDLLLGDAADGVALDIWSLGCVFGEMLTHAPLFPGGSEIETLLLQFRLLGTPTEASWPALSKLEQWSDQLPQFRPREGELLALARTGASAHVLRLMLRHDPSSRPAASVLLGHNLFADLDTVAHRKRAKESHVSEAGAPKDEGCARAVKSRRVSR